MGGIGDGLRFGARMLADTVGKAVPISRLQKEYFALKNGVLYWYQNERARRAKGQIVVRNIEAIEINAKNPLEISLLTRGKLYRLQSLDTKWYAQKWYNSLKLIKDMGDLQNLALDRYQKLHVYARENARIVFRDFEILLTAYETKICKKIILYKYNKIFVGRGKGQQEDGEDSDDGPARSASLRRARSASRGRSASAARRASSQAASPVRLPPPEDEKPSEDEQSDESEEEAKEEQPKPKLGKFGMFKQFLQN